MLFHLAYRPLSLGELEDHSDITKLIFLPRSVKLYILVVYRFLIKNNFGVNQCTFDHVISQNMEFIRLAISQPFFKIETSGLDQKIR